jgi:TAT (twin-arginine translocation) pathway-exported protein
MKDAVLSRRQLLKGAGAVGVLGAIGMPAAVFADDEEVELLRWDLVHFPQGVVLPGQDMARDAASGDVVTLTGSGEVEPKKETATGGGTFVHSHADGTELAHGVYRVTGFRSWKPAGGTLVGRPLQDGIGTLQQTIGGVLFLDVALMPAGASPRAGVLEVDCMLPGIEFPIEEGVNLSVGPFNFEKVPGSFTLFHVLQGVNQAN